MQTSDTYPHRHAGAQNAQIWMAIIMIGIEPTSAHKAGRARQAHELPPRSVTATAAQFCAV
jgi:hypothetical protein